jgi:hypothetical protein
LRIKFWQFSNSDVLLKLNIYKILLYDAYHICGVKRLVRSQPFPIPSSCSNETMPNAEQFMLTLSEHQTIQPVLVGFTCLCFSFGHVCVKLCGCFILFRYCYKCTNFAMYFSAKSLYYLTFTQYLFFAKSEHEYL